MIDVNMENIMNRTMRQTSTATAISTLIWILLSWFLLAGCSKRYVMIPPEPRDQQVHQQTRPVIKEQQIVYQPAIGPAGPLYHQAQTHASLKNYQQAEQVMERALRVEPKNGHYWYALAQIKFQQQQYPRAIQLCLKSKSMAPSDHQLRQLNDDLIQQVRKQQGSR